MLSVTLLYSSFLSFGLHYKSVILSVESICYLEVCLCVCLSVECYYVSACDKVPFLDTVVVAACVVECDLFFGWVDLVNVDALVECVILNRTAECCADMLCIVCIVVSLAGQQICVCRDIVNIVFVYRLLLKYEK